MIKQVGTWAIIAWGTLFSLGGCDSKPEEKALPIQEIQYMSEINLLQQKQFPTREGIKTLLSQKGEFVKVFDSLDTYQKILQEGNCQTYRNEEFGFQIDLSKEFQKLYNDCKVIQVIYPNRNKTIEIHIQFLFFDGNSESDSPFLSSGRSRYFQIGVIDKYNYHLPQRENSPLGREGLENNTIGENNLYYFLIYPGDPNYHPTIFPKPLREWYICEREEESNICWMRDLLKKGFSIFNV